MIEFKNITGGQGGQWVYVENLHPEGDLSLRHALTRTDIEGPRNIGFKVSGDIFGSINVKTLHNFTVHGSTSPGGICLRNTPDDMGDTLNIRTNNVIIDNLRIRPGHTTLDASEKRRALNFQGTKGAIVSNNSFTWAYDQIAGTWYGCEDILYYRNIIAEGFRKFSDTEYGMGCLVGDAKGGSGGGDHYFYQNVFSQNKGRNPAINIAGIAYLWGNLIYNPGDWVIHLKSRFGPPRMDAIGNILISGPQSNNNAEYLIHTASAPAEIYVYDNITPHRHQWWQTNQIEGVIVPGTENLNVRDAPFMPDIPFEMVAAQHLQNHLLRVVGPTPRDLVDARILNDIHQRIGQQIGNEADVRGYPDLIPPIIEAPPEIKKIFYINVPSFIPPQLTGANIIDRNLEGDMIIYTCEVD